MVGVAAGTAAVAGLAHLPHASAPSRAAAHGDPLRPRLAAAAPLTTQPPPPPLDPTPYGRPIAVGTPRTAAVAADAMGPGNVAALTEVARLAPPDGPNEVALAFTPDGQRLVTRGSGPDLWVRALPDGALERSLAGAAAWGPVVVSPDGTILAVGNASGAMGGSNVDLFDLALGERARQHRGGDGVLSLGFGADGELLSAARDDGRVHVWRVDSGALVADRRVGDGSGAVVVRPGRTEVAWLPWSGGELVLTDVRTGDDLQRRRLPMIRSVFNAVLHWRDDGDDIVVVASNDLSGARERVALVRLGGATLERQHDAAVVGRVAAVGWSEADDAAFVAGDTGVGDAQRAWVLRWPANGTPTEIFSLPNRDIRGLTVSPDGRLLAFGHRRRYAVAPDPALPAETRVVDAVTGRTLAALPGVIGPRFSPDGRRLVAMSDSASGTGLRLYGVPDRLAHRRFVPLAYRPPR